ncbi:putative glycoside hydrolase [Caulobacter segnis]
MQLTPVDAGDVQEAGRQISFAGDKPARLTIVGDKPLDPSFQTNAEMALAFDYRLDTMASAPVVLAMGEGKLNATPQARRAAGPVARRQDRR